MKHWTYSLFSLSLFLLLSCATIQQTDQIRSILFNDDSSTWSTKEDLEWTLSNGILSAENGLGYAVTLQKYKNFILEVEFNPAIGMNSGVFIRCPEEGITASGCYEINIADNHENENSRTGAIVTHGKSLEIMESENKWNRYKIIAKDDRIGVWLNGVKTADIRDSKSTEGTIALQVNGQGKIQFRNVVLTRLN